MTDALVHIIGGGYSGLVSAIKLAEHFGGKNIVISEKTDRVGKKILSTGNGQCNISNLKAGINYYHGNNPSFIVNSLEKYGPLECKKFYYSLGIPLINDEDKLYPMSKQASSVLDSLRFKIDYLKVKTELSSEIVSLKKEKGMYVSESRDGRIIKSKYVIIAVGGKSAKHLGTDGSSYGLATCFGHKLIQPSPSLVQLKSDDKIIKSLIGIKQKAKVSVKTDGKTVCFTGDLLFTNSGLSGNTIFSISAYVKGKEELLVDFCPELEETELYNLIVEKHKVCSYLGLSDLLAGIINKKTGESIIRCSLDGNKEPDLEIIRKLAHIIKNYRIKVTGTLGFDYSQVTHGGIDTFDIDDVTMESKISSNMFMTGEVVDVDGDCGGYNLQWAFSSALSAANGIIEKEEK